MRLSPSERAASESATSEPVALLVEVCESIARGDYDQANALFALTGPEASPDVGRLAEAFGMMLVRVEAREMHLHQLIEELRESHRQLEEAQVVREWNRRLRREVAERKRAEKLLRASQKELETAKAQAEAAAHAKAAFLATMSHEIRTPMNGVTTMAEILDRTRLTSEQREMTRTIRESASALLSVINDVLDFSKVEAGKLMIERVGFDPLDLVESVVEVLAPRAEAGGLSLAVELRAAPPSRLTGDPGRLRQILLNLGGNAVKFTEAGAVTFRVEVRHLDDGGCTLAVEVADTGIGMSPEQVARLFEPFAQGETSTARRYGGTGLGLAITRRLVDLMGGTIAVRTAPGQGATFRVELPLPVEDAGPIGPLHDLAPASVVLAGHPAPEAAALVGLLALGGVGRVATVDTPAAWAGVGPGADFVVVNAEAGPAALGAWARAIDEGAPPVPLRVLVTAPHAMVPDLTEDLPVAAGVDIQGVLARPVRARALWEHVAVALGARPRDSFEAARGEAVTYEAPAMEDARRHGAAVLVADDNPTNRLVLGMLLSRMGVAYATAEDGQAALRLLDEGRYGLLITDLHMPVMDGFELARAVRAREAAGGTGRMAIVASTADVVPETARRCAEAGMDGCLLKPIEIDKLVDALRRHVPAAFDLRRERADPSSGRGSGALRERLGAVDPDVFDPAPLCDAFGEFGAAAAALALRVVASAASDVAAVESAYRAGEWGEVGRRAHAARGALLSIGAIRLGRLMQDIGTAVEAGGGPAADAYVACLQESYDELERAVRPLALDEAAGRAAE